MIFGTEVAHVFLFIIGVLSEALEAASLGIERLRLTGRGIVLAFLHFRKLNSFVFEPVLFRIVVENEVLFIEVIILLGFLVRLVLVLVQGFRPFAVSFKVLWSECPELKLIVEDYV